MDVSAQFYISRLVDQELFFRDATAFLQIIQRGPLPALWLFIGKYSEKLQSLVPIFHTFNYLTVPCTQGRIIFLLFVFH